MRLISTIAEIKALARQVRARGKTLGLVPTMGALHEGHLSLVRQARRQADATVVSIFVNPTQFAPSEDFTHYPRNLAKDLETLRPYGLDAVFTPSVAEMYPEGFRSFVDPGEIASTLEGASRPGHFRGVATVILKLFNILLPDLAYFGQKDFQQVQVIRRLIQDLELDVRMVVCPTVRDPEGLAVSSRNTYLSPEERRAALVLTRSLQRAQQMVHDGETAVGKVRDEMQALFTAEPRARLDYAQIVGGADLKPLERVTAGSVALVGAWIGATRLIDNLIFGPPGASPELLLQLALTSQPVVDTGARVPGFETEALRLKIENCRECAAISSIVLPPREYLVKYLKQYYVDLNAVRTVVIGRDSPMNTDNFLYRKPMATNRFFAGLYDLLGVKDFEEFRTRYVLTDAVRCHSHGTRVSERALAYCARHLVEELKLFPNLDTIVLLGEETYKQFQQFVLGRSPDLITPFEQLLQEQGWAQESVRPPSLGERPVRAFYCYHPTYGYKRSPSIAQYLA